ncbi:hypothetical protein [Methylobacterium sp. NFXW15]|uniref:hypothetical protein n=1 Tax=Methylobacterium sp. NFXW15 TaxID=2819512 RepID=UPI003CF548A5
MASLELDLKLLKLRYVIQRKYSPSQPRAPAGQTNGGQWIDQSTGQQSRSNYTKIAETCQEYISANCRGKINREFPKQFLDRDVSDLKAAAQANEPGARKAYKLLFDNRFQK